MSNIEWQDITSYNPDDKERIPTCYEIKHGNLRIYITCGHRTYRPNWVLHCYAVGMDSRPLCKGGATPERAQELALQIVEARIDEIRDDMIIIKRSVNNG